MNRKHTTRVALLTAALLAILALSACDKDNATCTNHTDVDGNSLCDVCGQAVAVDSTTEAETIAESVSGAETQPTTTPIEKMITVTLADQDGAPIPGIELTMTPKAGGDPIRLTTGTTGTADVTLHVGDYTVTYGELPIYHLGGTSQISVTDETEGILLEVQNNTPNGTEERPFIINEEHTTVKIPAGASYCFSMFGGKGRILTIENAQVEVKVGETTYAPDSNGYIEVPIVSESDRDRVHFTVTSKATAELSLELIVQSKPGTMENPIQVQALNTPVSASVPRDGIIYYVWTATLDGLVTVTSDMVELPEAETGVETVPAGATVLNNISLQNLNTSETTPYTNGAASASVKVKTGDRVCIIVGALGGDREAEFLTVIFSVSESEAAPETQA